MHFTLLGIMAGTVSALAGRIGALSRKFCGMVGANCVVVRTIGALVVRVSALAVRVGAQAGAISVVFSLSLIDHPRVYARQFGIVGALALCGDDIEPLY